MNLDEEIHPVNVLMGGLTLCTSSGPVTITQVEILSRLGPDEAWEVGSWIVHNYDYSDTDDRLTPVYGAFGTPEELLGRDVGPAAGAEISVPCHERERRTQELLLTATKLDPDETVGVHGVVVHYRDEAGSGVLKAPNFTWLACAVGDRDCGSEF